jgi:hypothetical protein
LYAGQKELNFMKQSSPQTNQQIHQWLPQTRRDNFPSLMSENVQTSSTSKATDLKGNK